MAIHNFQRFLLSLFFILCLPSTKATDDNDGIKTSLSTRTLATFSNFSLSDEEVRSIAHRFDQEPHRVFRDFNEGVYFKQIYKRINGDKEFSTLNEEEYREFLAVLGFNKETSHERQIFNLMLWANLAGCPLLAVDQERNFFYDNKHILPKVSCSGITASNFETIVYSDRAELKGTKEVRLTPKSKPIVREFSLGERQITQDLIKNAIFLIYFKDEKFDKEDYSDAQSDPSKVKHPVYAEISYDFLKSYIVSLRRIHFLDQVLHGLEALPKSMVDIMRGKAIYLSTQDGVSMHTAMTSHNAPITSYLGLIPGIFIENDSKKRLDQGIGMICRAVVHEIGHLIDLTVLRPFYTDETQQTLPFPYRFPIYFNLKEDRDRYFQMRVPYVKIDSVIEAGSSDLQKTSYGYVTNYAESTAKEDFAEHFTYYILYQDKFAKQFLEEAPLHVSRHSYSLPSERELLKLKFEFMKRLVSMKNDDYLVSHISTSAATTITHAAAAAASKDSSVQKKAKKAQRRARQKENANKKKEAKAD